MVKENVTFSPHSFYRWHDRGDFFIPNPWENFRNFPFDWQEDDAKTKELEEELESLKKEFEELKKELDWLRKELESSKSF